MGFFLDQFHPDNDDAQIYILSSSVDQRDITKASQYQVVKDYLSKPLIKKSIKLIFTDRSSIIFFQAYPIFFQTYNHVIGYSRKN